MISCPLIKGHVLDMESVKSRHHFVDEDLINTWMNIIGKCCASHVMMLCYVTANQ